jgi:hypothetical protein
VKVRPLTSLGVGNCYALRCNGTWGLFQVHLPKAPEMARNTVGADAEDFYEPYVLQGEENPWLPFPDAPAMR